MSVLSSCSGFFPRNLHTLGRNFILIIIYLTAGHELCFQSYTSMLSPVACAQVRLVFDAPSASALPSGRDESRNDPSDEEEDEGDEDGEGGLPLNGRSRGRDAKQAGGGSRAAAVIAMLHQVSEEQVQEISQVCRCAPLPRLSSGAPCIL